jgi:hypothetical protein
MGNVTAQINDNAAGDLQGAGAQGGPTILASQTLTFGVNDPLGCDAKAANCIPATAAFNPIVFTEYDARTKVSGGGRNNARQSIARGQALFNTFPIPIVHNAFGLAVSDMPVYTLRNKTTGETKIVTDPGRALITGKWKDVGPRRVPQDAVRPWAAMRCRLFSRSGSYALMAGMTSRVMRSMLRIA